MVTENSTTTYLYTPNIILGHYYAHLHQIYIKCGIFNIVQNTPKIADFYCIFKLKDYSNNYNKEKTMFIEHIYYIKYTKHNNYESKNNFYINNCTLLIINN